jgi:hypothetical protein
LGFGPHRAEPQHSTRQTKPEARPQPQEEMNTVSSEVNGEVIARVASGLITMGMRRSKQCPLMGYVLRRYGHSTEEAVLRQASVLHFYHWCGERTIVFYTHQFPWHFDLLEVFDKLMQGIVAQMHKGDPQRTETHLDQLDKIFAEFDQASERNDGPGWAYWLGVRVLDFIHGGPSDVGMDSPEWTLATQLPSKVLTELHEQGREILRPLTDAFSPPGLSGHSSAADTATKRYKPDYGLRHMEDGVSPNLDFYFYDFRLFSLSVLGPGKYTTMVEMPYEGEPHALSLDFNQKQLEQILSKAAPQIRDQIFAEIAGDPASQRTICFEGDVSFAVRARLGQLQKVQGESLVPLVATEIL